MTLTLSFLGRAGTVTGSGYLVEVPTAAASSTADCSRLKQLRLCNSVRCRHTDYVARGDPDACASRPLRVSAALVATGFAGPIYCPEATRDLCEVLLRDTLPAGAATPRTRTARLFEHLPALPLYTADEPKRALAVSRRRVRRESGRGSPSASGRRAAISRGAAPTNDAGTKLVFSGDLGRSPIRPCPSRA